MEEAAFYSLIEEVVSRMIKKFNTPDSKWISGEQAMSLLNITSKTTLQKFRDKGKIRFSQPEKRIVLYDRDSILELLEKHARNTF